MVIRSVNHMPAKSLGRVAMPVWNAPNKTERMSRRSAHPCKVFTDGPPVLVVIAIAKSDSCGVRTHALADWRLEPAP